MRFGCRQIQLPGKKSEHRPCMAHCIKALEMKHQMLLLVLDARTIFRVLAMTTLLHVDRRARFLLYLRFEVQYLALRPIRQSYHTLVCTTFNPIALHDNTTQGTQQLRRPRDISHIFW